MHIVWDTASCLKNVILVSVLVGWNVDTEMFLLLVVFHSAAFAVECFVYRTVIKVLA